MPSHDTVRIPLWGRAGTIRAYALVDADDAEWVNQWRWHLGNKGYAKRNHRIGCRSANKTLTILLHRALLGLDEHSEVIVDHIDRDRLNNRRCNFRFVTPSESAQNKGKYKNATSKYRGVYWHKVAQKWRYYQGAWTHYQPRTVSLRRTSGGGSTRSQKSLDAIRSRLACQSRGVPGHLPRPRIAVLA